MLMYVVIHSLKKQNCFDKACNVTFNQERLESRTLLLSLHSKSLTGDREEQKIDILILNNHYMI